MLLDRHASVALAGKFHGLRLARFVEAGDAEFATVHTARDRAAPAMAFVILVHMHQDTSVPHAIERVQTGVRIEKRILKVMKALAEYHDLTLGDLIEGIVLHAFEGKSAFGGENLKLIGELKAIYHLDLDASASHKLVERKTATRKRS